MSSELLKDMTSEISKQYYAIFKLKSIKFYMYISGFETKMLSVAGLEVYWPYRFKVNAATVKGNTTSDFSSIFKTKKTKQAGKKISVFF